MQGVPLDDGAPLFCHELLCAEALDNLHVLDVPSLHSWHSLQEASFEYIDYGDYLYSSSWSSSPSLQLHPWSSFLPSASPFPFHDYPHHLECSLHSDERLTNSSACSTKLSSVGSSCTAASSDETSSDLASCMQESSFHGKLHGSAVAAGSEFCAGGDEEDGGERMRVLLERQRWQHCRPMKEYAERMQQSVYGCKELMDDCGEAYNTTLITMCRRRGVQWMLEVGRMLQVNLSSVAQAVTYLDRYLSHRHVIKAQNCHVLEEEDVHVASVSCLWIALKMEHSNAPDAAFMIQKLARMYQYSRDEGVAALKAMEGTVLQVLAWRLLGVSSLDFVDSILSTFQATSTKDTNDLSGLIPNHLIHSLQIRAYEIVQGTFLEAVFAGYEALVVGVCAIQHVVEEIVPLQTPSIMQIIQGNVAHSLHMEEVSKCYKIMGDLVIYPLTTTSINIASSISHDMIYNVNTLL